MTADKKVDEKISNQPEFRVVTQYLKDLSFECPNSNMDIDEKDLQMEIGVSIETVNIAEGLYETSVKLGGQAKKEDKTVFLAEVNYSGRFAISNFPEEQKDVLLGVETPSILYPFARRILMNCILDAGFRVPQIDPIDFAGLFMQSKQQTGQQPEEQKKIEDK